MGKNGDVPRFFSLPQSSRMSFKVPGGSRKRRKLPDGNYIPDDAIAPRLDFTEDFEFAVTGVPRIFTPEQTYNYKSAWKRYEKGMELVQQEKVLKDPSDREKYKVLSPKAPNGFWEVSKNDSANFAILYTYLENSETKEECSLDNWGYKPFTIGNSCGSIMDEAYPKDTSEYFQGKYNGYPYSTQQEAETILPLISGGMFMNNSNYSDNPDNTLQGTQSSYSIHNGTKYEFTSTETDPAAFTTSGFSISTQSYYVNEDITVTIDISLAADIKSTLKGVGIGINKSPTFQFYNGTDFNVWSNYDYLNTSNPSFSTQFNLASGQNYQIFILAFFSGEYPEGGTQSLEGYAAITTNNIGYKKRKFLIYDSSVSEAISIQTLDSEDEFKAYLTYHSNNLIYADIKAGKSIHSPNFAKVYHFDITNGGITNPSTQPVDNNNWQNSWTNNYQISEQSSSDICADSYDANQINIVEEIIYSIDFSGVKEQIKLQDVSIDLQIINATRENDQCIVDAIENMPITLPKLQYPSSAQEVELLAVSFFPGNSDSDENGGGNGDGGNKWQCDCPDSSKKKFLNPNNASGNENLSDDWTDSNAGAQNGQCKHIWAVKILRGEVLPEDIPTDMPISENFPTKNGAIASSRVIGGQGGIDFDNWNPNKQRKE